MVGKGEWNSVGFFVLCEVRLSPKEKHRFPFVHRS